MGDTAKIHDLTAYRRARAARQVPLSADEAAKAARVAPPCGGAWYHEAAIRDDDRTRRS